MIARKLGLLSLMLISDSCSSLDIPRVSEPSCSVAPVYGKAIKALEVSLHVDQHGGYASILSCPEKSYSFEFSPADLLTHGNPEVARILSERSVLPGMPVKLMVDGYIREGLDDEVRDTFVITSILKYYPS